MNSDQLQTFQMVAATGSFTKASRKLLISQSAVSQQIRALEALVGVRLFDRTGKKIHLTQEGQLLLKKSRKISNDLHEIKILFDDLSNLERGRLEFGSSAVFGTYFLPKLLAQFNIDYPGIAINLHTGNSHEIISRLLNGEFEFGFGSLYEDESEIDYTLIHQEQLVAVVERNHPLARKEVVTLEDLRNTKIILREKGTRIRRDTDAWLKKFDKSLLPNRFAELENIEISKKLIEEGFGMTIVPKAAVKRELCSGEFKVIDLPNFDLNTYYYLYYPRHRTLSQAARAFLTLMPKTVSLSHCANLDIVEPE